MTLQQLFFFREVARVKHFTLASKNLHISQSNLSHSIQALERELGVSLFIRKLGSKTIKLTNYGLAFLPHVEKILDELEKSQQSLAEMRNPMSGVVTIAYSYLNGFSLVPKIFNQFYLDNNYDEVTAQFKINHHKAKFEEEVVTGEVDLAICCTASYEGVKTLPIAKQKLMVMLPANHPLAGKKKLRLDDLRDDQLFCYYRGGNLYNWIERMYQEAGFKPNMHTHLLDWASQIALVSLGQGFTIAPRLPVDSDLISVIELDHPTNVRDIYLMWSESRELSAPVEYIKQYCIKYCKKNECLT